MHHNSKYIGKFFTLFTTYLGWRVSLKAKEHYNYSKRVANFHLYPREIQRTLDNNDYRYARTWLNVDAIIEQKKQDAALQKSLLEPAATEAASEVAPTETTEEE